jgi:hypothetical protein
MAYYCKNRIAEVTCEIRQIVWHVIVVQVFCPIEKLPQVTWDIGHMWHETWHYVHDSLLLCFKVLLKYKGNFNTCALME